MRTLKMIAVVVAGCLLTVSSGCGGGGGGGTGNTVEGKVTYKGSPVGEGKVKFISTTMKNGAAQTYEGMTNSSGEYLISGLEPGNYKIAISKLVDPSGKPLNPEEGMDYDQLELSGQGKNVLPKKYATEGTSGLEMMVKGGENKKDFPLTD